MTAAMNLERAALRGKLSEAQEKELRLRRRCEALAGSLRLGLNTALTPVAELDVPALADQMDDLVAAWAELAATASEISRLERELR